MDSAELDAARTAFLREMAPFLTILAAALIAAGWVQASYGLRPLSTLGVRIGAVRAGRATRLGTDVPPEVRPIAAELDALIEAREQDVARARTRAADLAHGLKTPLQALLGEADRLARKGDAAAAASLEDLARAMQRRVDRELARIRVAAHPGGARSNVADVTRRIVSVVRRTPAGSRLDWRIDAPDGIEAAIDPVDFAEALGALMENAARYAAERVTVTASHAAGRVRVTVRDDGPGIPADRMDALTERGARVDESAGQTGLGLAIAREVAEAAGGALELRPGSPGLVASLFLPVAESRARDRSRPAGAVARSLRYSSPEGALPHES